MKSQQNRIELVTRPVGQPRPKAGAKTVMMYTPNQKQDSLKKVLPCKSCGKAVEVPITTYKKLTEFGLNSCIFRCSVCSKLALSESNSINQTKPEQAEVKVEPKDQVQNRACPETIDLNYKCTKCGKVFRDSNALQYHYNLHNNHFPFKCDSCDFKSHSLRALNNHTTRTHKERKEPCSRCGEHNFYNNPNNTMSRHDELHHRSGQ